MARCAASEQRAADAGEHGGRQTRHRVPGGGQEGDQDRPDDEHGLVDHGLQGVGRLHLARLGRARAPSGPARRCRPAAGAGPATIAVANVAQGGQSAMHRGDQESHARGPDTKMQRG